MNTNIKSLRESVEDVARKYLGIPYLSSRSHHITNNLTDKQIEKALREAYKMGEKAGYDHGYASAKEACECPEMMSLEDVIGNNKIVIDKIVIDKIESVV